MEPETARTPDGSDSVAELATEYLLRTETGEAVDSVTMRSTLLTEGERAEFDQLLEMARVAQRHFPVTHSCGAVLGGRYRLLRELGVGGMGKVWLAHDAELDRQVAVKVLNLLGIDALESLEPAVSLELRESRLLAQLNHPNIVGIHEFDRDGDTRYLVMDFVDGRPLSTIIDDLRAVAEKTGAVPSPDDLLRTIDRPLNAGLESLVTGTSWYHAVATVLAQAARAVEAAHARGVVHRDLKPANVMLRGGGHPMLLDFGLGGGTQATGGMLTQRLYGTAAYLAPEQIENEQVGTDPRTDVYQLGLVLYELVTLRRAFAATDTARLLHDIYAGNRMLPRAVDPKLPAELEDICLMALDRDPERRYQSAAELRADLERFASRRELPRASRGRSGSMRRRLSYFVRRHRLSSTAAAAIAATAAAIGVLSVSSRDVFEPYEVQVGGTWTARMQTDRTRCVYAFLLERDPVAGPVALRPMVPRLLGEPAQAAGWALRVEPGKHIIVCSDERDSEVPKHTPALCFLTCSEESSKRMSIEAAWDQLERAMRRSGRSYVPVADAQPIFASLQYDGRGAASSEAPLTLADVLDESSSAEIERHEPSVPGSR